MHTANFVPQGGSKAQIGKLKKMQTLSMSMGLSLNLGLRVCMHKQKQTRHRKVVCISGSGAGEEAARRRMQWQTSCSVISATAAAAAEAEEVEQITTEDEAAARRSRILRVAYQGSPGSFSEAAAEKVCERSERWRCEAVPCEELEGAFHAVELWLADRAVLALENTLGGTIHRNYDLLLRHRLHVVAELQLPERQCLLALPGTRVRRIRRVMSHPQALAQCEATLDALLPSAAARHAFADTAAAAQHIAALRLRDTAVVAGARAAELYGLEVLAGDVHDDPVNVTRFAVLAREPAVARLDRGKFKTSIAFAFPLFSNGGLFKVLSALAFRRISVVKIESRPHRRRVVRVVEEEAAVESVGSVSRRFDYMFYVDLEASLAEPRAQHALADIMEFTSFMRVLGSYPMDTDPISVPVSSTNATSSSSATV